MKNSNYNKHIAALSRKVLTKGDISSLCRLLNNFAASSLDWYEKNEIHQHFSKNLPFKIKKDHTTQGIEFLLKSAFTKRGEARAYKNYPFDPFCLRILQNFKRFELIDIHDLCTYDNRAGSDYHQYTPCYRVLAKDGTYFDYHMQGQWSLPEIFNRGGDGINAD